MQSDRRYAVTMLRIQFSYGPNEAYRGFTSVDHCNSCGKLDCQQVGFEHPFSVCATAGAKDATGDSDANRC